MLAMANFHYSAKSSPTGYLDIHVVSVMTGTILSGNERLVQYLIYASASRGFGLDEQGCPENGTAGLILLRPCPPRRLGNEMPAMVRLAFIKLSASHRPSLESLSPWSYIILSYASSLLRLIITHHSSAPTILRCLDDGRVPTLITSKIV
jgi:hypothetical protein